MYTLAPRLKRAVLIIFCAGLIVFQANNLWATPLYDDDQDCDIDGVDLYPDAPEIRQLRQDVGMVFQQFNLFPHLTVLENLMIGPMKVRILGNDKGGNTNSKVFTIKLR